MLLDISFRDMDIPARNMPPEIPVPLGLRFALDYDAHNQRLTLRAVCPGISLLYQGRGRVFAEDGMFLVPPLTLLDPFLNERRYIAARHMKIVLRVLLPKLQRDGVNIDCALILHAQSAASVMVREVSGTQVSFDLHWRAPLALLRDLVGFDGHVIAGNDIFRGEMRHLTALPSSFDGSLTLKEAEAVALGRLCDLADYLFSGENRAALRMLGRGIQPEAAELAMRRRAVEGLAPPPPAQQMQLPAPKKQVFDNPVVVSVSVRPHARPSAAKYTPFVMEAKRLAEVTAQPAPAVPLQAYWPVYSMMSEPQRAWYFYWRQEFLAGNPLACDLSYLFLYLYECINRTAGSAEEGLSRMLSLWRAYRADYPRLDRYLPEWCLDFIFLNRLDVPFDHIFQNVAPESGMLGSMPEVFFSAPLAQGLHKLPFDILCLLSGYDIKKSRFYKGQEALCAAGVAAALQVLDDGMRASRSEALLTLLLPPSQTVVWDSYRGAVCGRTASRRIELTYRPLMRAGKLRTFLADVFRCVENTLRKQTRFPGRLRTNLSAALCSAVEQAVAGINTQAQSATFETAASPVRVDLSRALELESASWETTRWLLEAAGQEDSEPDEPIPAHASPETNPAPLCASALQSQLQVTSHEDASDAAESDDLWAVFFARLSPLAFDVLSALYRGEDMSVLDALCIPQFTFPDAVFEEINEHFLSVFGDVLIEPGADASIIEDYRGGLSQML